MIRVPTAPWAHLLFDLVAWSSGLALSVVLYRWRLSGVAQAAAARIDGRYFAALAAGAALGAWAAGSLNSLREHAPALSHSVAGALVGAIVAVEIYKAFRGVRISTGGVFVGRHLRVGAPSQPRLLKARRSTLASGTPGAHCALYKAFLTPYQFRTSHGE